MKTESYNHIKAVTNKIIKAMKDCSLGSIVKDDTISLVMPEKARREIELTLSQMVRNIIRIEKT